MIFKVLSIEGNEVIINSDHIVAIEKDPNEPEKARIICLENYVCYIKISKMNGPMYSAMQHKESNPNTF
ncbi:MAG: hypothetical protein MUO72_19450 [Bacteroidales bacterium]|nr:hypothetical protein [Bacteroidales bacterium]